MLRWISTRLQSHRCKQTEECMTWIDCDENWTDLRDSGLALLCYIRDGRRFLRTPFLDGGSTWTGLLCTG